MTARAARGGAAASLLPFFALAILGCAAAAAPAPEGGDFSLDAPFEIAFAESAAATLDAQNVLIIFREVAEDSRCPTGVQCISQGNARVVLAVRVGDEAPRDVTLNTSRGDASAAVGAFRVALLDVAPYPSAKSPTPPQKYLAKLVVTRL